MTASLTGAWLGVSLVQVIAWIGACVLGAGVGKMSIRLRGLATIATASLGTAAAIGAAALGVQLVMMGWSFGAEKVLIAAPIGLLSSAGGLALAVSASIRSMRSRAPAPRWLSGVLVSAALGATIGLLSILVVGSEVGWPAVVAAVAVWLSGSAIAIAATTGRPVRVVVSTSVVAALCVGLLALFTVFGPTTGSAASGHHIVESADDGSNETSVADLRETDAGTGVHRFALEARHESIALPDGSRHDALTFGSVPGPELRVTQGELVEVTLTNRDVEEGVTLHWHGYDVPGGDDGVAGVTQNAVAPGESFVYRFVADEVGTYWYHTHQGALDGIRRGLYGTLVVLPVEGIPEETDATASIHTISGTTLVDGESVLRIPADGTTRLRLINTDQTPRRLVLDGIAEVLALDGHDLNRAVAVPAGTVLRIPAGGRLDLGIEAGGTTALDIEGAGDAGVVVGTGERDLPALAFTGPEFDVLDAAAGRMPPWSTGPFDVHADQVLDRLIRVVEGVPRLADTINGAAFPYIEPIVVSEGQIVEVTISNRSSETHPMHLHGHRMLVLSRDGVQLHEALWLDTIDVRAGEVWRVAFVADNPGLWMDHCHNLEHAAAGMVMHVSYRGITSPFDLGGDHGNRPE